MKLDDKKIASAVLEKREKEDLTFRAIAKQTKNALTPSTLHRVEAGNASAISVKTYLALCKWLNVSPAHFVS